MGDVDRLLCQDVDNRDARRSAVAKEVSVSSTDPGRTNHATCHSRTQASMPIVNNQISIHMLSRYLIHAAAASPTNHIVSPPPVSPEKAALPLLLPSQLLTSHK